MFLICSVWNCPSNEVTEIDGRKIKFFQFPNDETLYAKWDKICKSICNHRTKDLFRLCELHFEKHCFSENMELKSNAIPTLFEHPNRRKSGKGFQRPKIDISPPAKKFKSENEIVSSGENDEEFYIETLLEDEINSSKIAKDESFTLNNSAKSLPDSENLTRYRLIIEVSKVCTNSKSKSKRTIGSEKIRASTRVNKSQQSLINSLVAKMNQQNTRLDNQHLPANSSGKKIQPSLRISDQIILNDSNKFKLNSSEKFEKARNCQLGCQLERIIDDKGESFRCIKCNNVYRKSVPTDVEVSSDNDNETESSQVQIPKTKKVRKNKMKNVKNVQTADRKKVQTPNLKNVQKPQLEKVNKSVIRTESPDGEAQQPNLDIVETIDLSSDCERTTEPYRENSCESASRNKPKQIVSNEIKVKTEMPNILKRNSTISNNIALDIETEIFQHALNSSENIPRCPNGCQLVKIVLSDSLAFKCQQCNNIYTSRVNNNSISNSQTTNSELATKNDQIAENNDQGSKKIVKTGTKNKKISGIDENYQCTICGEILPSSQEFLAHIQAHLTCDICFTSFKTQFEIRNHINDVHTSSDPRNPFQCHICDFTFDSKVNLKYHIKTGHELHKPTPEETIMQIFHCWACNLHYLTDEELKKHLEFVHRDRSMSRIGQMNSVKFSCTACGMEFGTLHEIQRHTQIHLTSSEKTFKCNICQQVFICNNLFQEHLREHISRGFHCGRCSKTFIDEISLTNHLENHV